HSAQWRELIHPDDLERFDQEIERAVTLCTSYALEYRVRHNEGHYVDIWERGRATFSRLGKALLTGSIVDFTARRLAEAQVAHLLAEEQSARAIAETASRLKDEFLATVSHELRTPLHAISGWAHVLARAELSPEDQARAVDAILRNAKAQNRIIEDILDVSRIITGKLKLDLQPLDLVTVVESALDTVRPTAAAKKIRVETSMERSRLPVLGDAARLQQAAWNILINALKFTPSGGTVTIGLRETSGSAQLTVTDTGIGISQDFLPHVFERFRQADGSITRRHGGLGLGLAIVRHIVEMHGGAVHAESAGEGRGATFVLSIPIASGAQFEPAVERWRGPSQHEERVEQARVDGLRVLVVDDEPDVLELVAKVLADAGAHVSTSCSAQGALELMNHGAFDLLILDIAMPDTDGYALMREIRSRTPDEGGSVPAIALTACAHAEERTRAFSAGFQCHLAKPIEPPALVNAVATLTRHGTDH
ncbi:MAG: ATP-binding protein, partial [Rhodospirillaceae bacterium]